MIVVDYWVLFFVDLIVFLGCFGAMLRFGRMTALHPAALYFFFHGYTFTFRLLQLANGAPTLFETWGFQYFAVRPGEIQRASLVAMLTLITMTIVWIYLAHRSRLRASSTADDLSYRPFSKRLMWMVVSITLPVGLATLVITQGPTLAGESAAALGVWSGSSYLISMYQWFGISLLALIFYYGFRPVLLLPLAAYLIVGLLSFPARMMVIIPGLFVVFVYLRRANMRWPRPRVILIFVTTVLVFVAGKDFGPLLRQGDFVGAKDLLIGRVADMRSGMHIDGMFMDMMAVVLTQIDERGQFYYGGTYTGLLVLPIPRALWPDKPGQADWQRDVQSADRPTGEIGAIATAIGEAYANLGYPGIILYAVVLAVLLNSLYRWMLRAPYYSLANFWSLCVYAILIQVFRDGLISFVIFQVTILLPLTIITVFHLLFLRRRYDHRGVPIGWSTIFDRYGDYLDAQGNTRRRIYGSK